MWTKTEDGSVLDSVGNVIVFSTERFIQDICLGECCFLCGANPESKTFNDEHVLPEWLLRYCGLFDSEIILPNEGRVRYDRYKVPCCAECNKLMGDLLEQPISDAMKGGYAHLSDWIVNGGSFKVFVWMALIFFKTHLRDRTHRLHLDARRGAAKISDEYDWELLHHLHSLVRCFHTSCFIEESAIGSFLILPVMVSDLVDRFDFGDLFVPQTMFMRLNDIGIVAVFDDANGALTFFADFLQKITRPVSEIQLREIMVELAWLNLHLKVRPTFATECDLTGEKCRLVVERPQHVELVQLDRGLRGKLLYGAVRHLLQEVSLLGHSYEEGVALVKSGDLSFLRDDHGQFIEQSWKRL
jgi:hypothetical protein